VNGAFARLAGVDRSEMVGGPGDYPSVSAFFVRELRPGLRSWPDSPVLPGSPVDGQVGAFGDFSRGTALQAKGISYSTADLLGSREDGDRFRQGRFLTLYLSPRHYHRIHAPARIWIAGARAVPGRLLPVNRPTVRAVGDLFPRNERLVVLAEGEGYRMALVAVGAFNVGRISTTFDPEWNEPGGRGVTNRGRRRAAETRSYRPPLEVEAGDEIMRFHLGSTVVLLVSPRDGASAVPAELSGGFAPGLEEGREIRLGDPLFLQE
jgi:phosphatidylserine decarboxylase